MTRPAQSSAHLRPSSRDVPAFLEGALDVRWRKYRRAFDRCRKKSSENSVHQLRVETRRLLAVLNLLDAWVSAPELAALRRTLKRLFKSLARLRDTQVQLLFGEKHQKRMPAVAPFLGFLERREMRLVKKLNKKLQRTGRKEIKRLAAGLRQMLDAALEQAGLRTQGHSLVLGKVHAAYAQVCQLRRRIKPACSATIHRTRIAFKQFRYLVELLQPLLPGVSARQVAAMHRYQSLMGEIQDLEVLQGALDGYVRKRIDAAPALGPFRREIARQHRALVAQYLARADDLRRFWPLPSTRTERRFPNRLTVSAHL
jgi:CHAD domain-containing protein